MEISRRTILTYGSNHSVWWKCAQGHEWQAMVKSRCNGSGCPLCTGRKVQRGINDLGSVHPELAAQWHPEKNGVLTPQQVTPYSNKRVWWLCPLGHEYQAVVGARTMHGSGCPYCSGHRTLPGFNDLATLDPLIAAQWHPVLNGNLTPYRCPSGTASLAYLMSLLLPSAPRRGTILSVRRLCVNGFPVWNRYISLRRTGTEHWTAPECVFWSISIALAGIFFRRVNAASP